MKTQGTETNTYDFYGTRRDVPGVHPHERSDEGFEVQYPVLEQRDEDGEVESTETTPETRAFIEAALTERVRHLFAIWRDQDAIRCHERDTSSGDDRWFYREDIQ